jgi:hypothetical protein
MDLERNSFDKNPDARAEAAPVQNGAGLERLYGIFADGYRAFGGGEAYLIAERDWGPDVWERYEMEEVERLKQEQIENGS